MIKNLKLITSLLLAAIVYACSGSDDGGHQPPPPEQEEVVGIAQWWVTKGDQSVLLVSQPNLDIVNSTTTSFTTITVNPAQQYQEIEGFGAALTGSSAYLINQKLNASQRQSLLNDLFDKTNGIGISYLRLTMGASDFSLQDYTYNDMPSGQQDPDLNTFSIAGDEDDVIPVLQQILGINPDIKLMGSPWSAPAWMKTGQNLHGGSLQTQWYDAYADYFVKYINAYAAIGITIDAVTPQNEPLHETAAYPSMLMPATSQAQFIGQSLGPAFATAGINTKIIAYDHNFDQYQYPITVLNNSDANQYISGSAFHAYAGNVSAMSAVHNAHPDKGLYFTEISGGNWSLDFSGNLEWNMENILIGTTKNWSKTALFWNLALNENHGPANNGCTDCRGVVTISSTGQIIKNVEYYSIAHFSKFVKAGAYRINSSNASDSSINNVAFQNPDGSKVLILLNKSQNPKTVSVIIGDNRFDCNLDKKSVATITWN